jgi:hypothetical protein
MNIIRNMTLTEGYDKYGTICDPKTCKVYKCGQRQVIPTNWNCVVIWAGFIGPKRHSG